MDDIHSNIRSEGLEMRRGEGRRAGEPKKVNEAMSRHNPQF